MPCQCGTTAALTDEPNATAAGCGCGSGADPDAGSGTTSGCACASGTPSTSDREASLERVVMELDKRVRKLEASR